jgi:hypothetical protein
MMAPAATLPAMTFLVEGADRLKATDEFEDANGVDSVELTNELRDDGELVIYTQSAKTVKTSSVSNSRRSKRC